MKSAGSHTPTVARSPTLSPHRVDKNNHNENKDDVVLMAHTSSSLNCRRVHRDVGKTLDA